MSIHLPKMRMLPVVALLLLLTSCGLEYPEAVEAAVADLPERVDFNQHIRPLLADRCWSCHGPDAEARQAQLRLDTEEGAFAALSSGAGRAFVAGSPGKSVALARMVSDDPETVMPPPESHLELSPYEIALFARWVEEGATWKKHWAFLPPEEVAVPDNPEGYPAANEIDHFINRELARRKLPANGRADDERLLRRLCLDLTGLPPDPALMDRWLAAPTAEHYSRLVDSLLTTDAHAERLALEWMDIARYSDSHGLHADGQRLSWPFRDWVINAFRENKSFDQFVTEQLAGDLLPEAGREQLLATAFNRMHPMTAEGGAIDEEFRLSYVFDRVNTVATGLLGLTMDCSRCHDHKFDPLSQEEYYSFSAFFNNIEELGMTGDDGNYGPYMLLADDRTDSLLRQYQEEVKALEAQRSAITVSEEELSNFLANLEVEAPRPDWHLPVENIRPTEDGQRLDGTAWATKEFTLAEDAERGTVIEYDHPYQDLFFDDRDGVIDSYEPLSASLYAMTHQRDSSKNQALLCTAGDKNQVWRGMEFYLDTANRLNLRLIRTLPDDLLHVRSTDSIPTNAWRHLAFSYDGSGSTAGIQLYIEGEAIPQETLFSNLRGRIYPGGREVWKKAFARKLRVGRAYRVFTGENGIFIGKLDDIRVFDRDLTPAEMAAVAGKAPAIDRKVARRHLTRRSPEYDATLRQLRATQEKYFSLADTLPRMMIAEDRPTVRPTYVLDRGAYDAPRQEVVAATPRSVLPYPEEWPRNRLGLSKWLFDSDNPLTARVTVNRYWQLIFGQGIVSTPQDFGSQGALPTHPELLDYLAISFRDGGWDVRELIKAIVHSDVYRRSSTTSPEQREADPDNRYLARGKSHRMPAEMIRDNALAAAGLLNTSVGGPSVRPYQPPGLWVEATNFSFELQSYQADEGDDLYRRSLYTFIRRTVPPPFLVNFDVANRDACVVKRSQTNTPLQALNLLNDPQFVEAARVLAQRVQREKTETNEQLNHAFRLVTGRIPRPEEGEVLRRLYEEEKRRFVARPQAADSLLNVGEYPLERALDPIATAALASVGNVLFSFDEAYVIR